MWVRWINRYLIRKNSFWLVKESSSLGSMDVEENIEVQSYVDAFLKGGSQQWIIDVILV